MAPLDADIDSAVQPDEGCPVADDAVLASKALPFACEFCGCSFLSRNKLFRHLKNNAACAEAGGYVAEEPKKPRSQQPVPPLELERPQVPKKAKPTPGERKKLNLDTRPDRYEEELAAKVAVVREQFSDVGNDALPDVEVFASAPEHFRLRVEFDIWHDDQGQHYVMFDGRERIKVEKFSMAARVITDVFMPVLMAELRANSVLHAKLFQVNFHTTLRGDSLIALLYKTERSRAARRAKHNERLAVQSHEDYIDPMPGDVEVDYTDCPLDAAWEEAASRLRSLLSSAAGGASVSVIGRVKGKQRVLGRDYVEERLEVAGAGSPSLFYRQPAGFFCQPNGFVAQHMLSWVRAVAREDSADVHANVDAADLCRDDDLLELYCGNGNFSVALAPFFRRVLATELVKELVHAAEVNASANGVDNIVLARVSAEDLAEALDGGREFVRLAHVGLDDYALRTVLVDPPRAGLGLRVATFIARFPRIIYISCNPATMYEDLQTLRETHSIRRLATFDQFPYTEHLEMGMLLVRHE